MTASYPATFGSLLDIQNDLLGTNGTGNTPFGLEKRKRALNIAVREVIRELSSIPQIVDFYFTRTETVVAVSGRIDLSKLYPPFAGCSVLARGTGNTARQVDVVDPHEALSRRARGGEFWYPEGGALVSDDKTINDDYTIKYVWSPPNMVENDHVCLVPNEFQSAVNWYGAWWLARTSREMDADMFAAEYARQIAAARENCATMFKSMDSRVRVVEDYGHGQSLDDRRRMYDFLTPN